MALTTFPNPYDPNQKNPNPGQPPYAPGAQPKLPYALPGYTPPAGINSVAGVKEMQRWLGKLTVDGIWGPKSQNQFDKKIVALTLLQQPQPAPRTTASPEELSYAEDLYKLSLGIGKSDRGNHVMQGYYPPPNIRNVEDVRAFQNLHGLTADGIWGRRRAPPVADEASRKTSE